MLQNILLDLRIGCSILELGHIHIFQRELNPNLFRVDLSLGKQDHRLNGITSFPQEPPYLLSITIYRKIKLYRLQRHVFKFSLFRLAFMSFKFTPKNDEITDISTSNIAVFNLSPPQYVSYYFTGLVLFFQNIYNISYFRVIIFPRLISKRCTTIIYIPRTKCFQYFFTRCFCSICIQKEFTKRNSVYPI